MVPFLSYAQNCHQQQFHKKYWICHQCRKKLSSKRSYDEHMNIHNKLRPFACDECDYAAASQMTLRRHKLRNHIPRSDWGYHCPHCPEKYMEPASYQQHVIASHWGYSATFGCPYRDCTFSTKSSRYFSDHLSKHRIVMARSKSPAHGHHNMAPFKLDFDNLAIYLINDECGAGHSNGKTLRRYNIGFNQRPMKGAIYQDAVKIVEESDGKIARINVEKLLENEDRQESTRKKTIFRPLTEFTTVYRPKQKPTLNYPTNPQIPQFEPHVTVIRNNQIPMCQINPIDWIETEVVIDEETAREYPQLPDGQVDDFGLD